MQPQYYSLCPESRIRKIEQSSEREIGKRTKAREKTGEKGENKAKIV